MWGLLNSILGFILDFIHWLVFVKLTNWDKERLHRMGFESQEELDEFMRQKYEAEIPRISPEQEAELLRRFPQVREALQLRARMISPRESPGQRPSGFDDDREVF